MRERVLYSLNLGLKVIKLSPVTIYFEVIFSYTSASQWNLSWISVFYVSEKHL